MRRLADLLLAVTLLGCRGEPAATGDGSTSDRRTADRPALVEHARPDGPRPDLAVPGVCVELVAIDRLAQPLTCETKKIVGAAVAELPYDCHTQGIGRAASGEFVVSCMEESGGSSARVLSFPADANAGGSWSALASVGLGAAGANHPSGIQIEGQLFPVAIAPPSDKGPTTISFFRVGAGGALVGPLATLAHPEGHLGALAYATIDGETHLLGCGYDCATLTAWRAPGAGATQSFSRVLRVATSSLVDPGVDENVGSYNSLFLAVRCGDRTPLLFASHDDWLDVWALTDLGKPSLRMRKLAKRQISESVVRWKDRPLLYEGMTLELGAQGLRLWAAPHDFGTESFPSGTRCMQYVYRCSFAP